MVRLFCSDVAKALFYGTVFIIAVDFVLNVGEYSGLVYAPLSSSTEGQAYFKRIRNQVFRSKAKDTDNIFSDDTNKLWSPDKYLSIHSYTNIKNINYGFVM